MSVPQAPDTSLGTGWSWHLVPLGLEVPSEGFRPWCHRPPWQGSDQGVRGRGSRRGPSQLCVSLGPSQRPLWVHDSIPPALWLLWWADRFPDTPHWFPRPSLELFPPVNSPLSLECHETRVYIRVSVCVCYVAGWGWGHFMLGKMGQE